MKKKVLFALVIVMAWMVTSTAAFANSNNDAVVVPNQLPVELQGKIHSSIRMVNESTGEVQVFYPKLVGSHYSENGSSYLTYEFGIPAKATQISSNISNSISSLLPKSVQASSKNYSGCDSPISGCASLTFFYCCVRPHVR